MKAIITPSLGAQLHAAFHEIHSLRHQLINIQSQYDMAHMLNVALLHKIGGQAVFSIPQVAEWKKDFPYISIDVEPGLLCVKAMSQPPEFEEA